MNPSASNLLHALSTVGIRSVRFRILSQRDVTKHSTPIAILDDDDSPAHRMPRFSVAELFNAYSLTPRRGEYTLEVDRGQLSFVPSKSRVHVKTDETDGGSASEKRWKPKVSLRRGRTTSSRPRHFPSA